MKWEDGRIEQEDGEGGVQQGGERVDEVHEKMEGLEKLDGSMQWEAGIVVGEWWDESMSIGKNCSERMEQWEDGMMG